MPVVTRFVFFLSLSLGGATSAVAAWWLGAPIRALLPLSYRVLLLVAIAALGVLRDAKLISFWLPGPSRQVPPSVLRLHPVGGAALFGFELGMGFRTFITSSASYVAVFLASTVLITPSDAMVVGCGFGLGRGIAALGRRLAGDPDRWDEWLVAGGAPFESLATGALLVALLAGFGQGFP